jgi:hypothetical protein
MTLKHARASASYEFGLRGAISSSGCCCLSTRSTRFNFRVPHAIHSSQFQASVQGVSCSEHIHWHKASAQSTSHLHPARRPFQPPKLLVQRLQSRQPQSRLLSPQIPLQLLRIGCILVTIRRFAWFSYSLWPPGGSRLWKASCDPIPRRQRPSMPSRYAALGLAHVAPYDSSQLGDQVRVVIHNLSRPRFGPRSDWSSMLG